jgi:hypothetical protein
MKLFKNNANVINTQYADFEAYERNLESLQKAWLAGYEVDATKMTGTQAGRPESLDPEFTLLIHKMTECRFYNKLPKQKVKSPVLQWARKLDVAQMIAYSEGGDVDNISDKFDRGFLTVKYYGVKGEVTGQSRETEFIVDPMVDEEQNKMASMVRGQELVNHFGDESINPLQHDSVHNLVYKKARSKNNQILDLRGKKLQYVNLMEIDRRLTINHANVFNRSAFFSLSAINSLIENEIENKTFFTNGNPSRPDMRRAIYENYSTGMESTGGKGSLDTSIYMECPDPSQNPIDGATILNEAGTVFQANHVKAPSIPVSAQPSVVGTTTAYSMPAGSYNYAVVAINNYGQSIAREYTVTVVGSGNMVSFAGLAETAAVTGQEAIGYRIYRKSASSTNKRDYQYVRTFGLSSATWYDDNEWMPGCTHGYVMEWTPQIIRMAQLMPIYKLPYGVRKDAFEFLIKLYTALQIKAYDKVFIIKNIGPPTTT